MGYIEDTLQVYCRINYENILCVYCRIYMVILQDILCESLSSLEAHEAALMSTIRQLDTNLQDLNVSHLHPGVSW